MQEIEFNLLDEPWLPVRLPDNTVKEVSLTDALLHAHEYIDLAGEMPTQDAAVLRLLLAVLITVFYRVDAQGTPDPVEDKKKAFARWQELWQPGRLPVAPIRDYLAQWHDRFWLFHPDRPFWQVPQAKGGTAYGAAKLNGEMSESSNKLRLFSAYSGTGKTELTYAQAARWLLCVNGYDDTSAKPKGKGLPSVGAGWLGKIGFIQAQGHNLFETLLLNLTMLKDGTEIWQENIPCWELETPRSAERCEIAQPDGLAQLLTLQSRRLLLQRTGDRVTGFSLLGGDFFPRENAFAEQMTIWRQPPDKTGKVVFVPRRHDASKQFWREFPAVFCEGDSAKKPGVVLWVEKLQSRRLNLLDPHRSICFKISGVQYGDKDFFINDSFCDTLTFHTSLLDAMETGLRDRIRLEIENCEQTALQIGNLARDLATAAGDKNDTASSAARAQYYFTIDQPFRRWLQSIDPAKGGVEEKITQWEETARTLAQQMGQQMVKASGDAAIVGRKVVLNAGKKNETSYLCTAPRAYNIFLARLRKIYPKEEQQEQGGTV